MYSNNIFNQAKNSIDIRSTVVGLLPRGKKEGNEWVALNPIRDDKNLGSFRINLNNGKWIDHATGDKGGDVISLYAYLRGTGQKEAAHSLLENGLNFKNQSFVHTPPKVPKPPKADITQYINKLWRESLDSRHSIVDSYLQHRELLLDSMPSSIRYHPNLYHTPTGKSFPAMLSAVTKYGNAGITGLHRTYLKVDGVDKAYIPRNKMMLGQVIGGAVQFGVPNGKLMLAEGIETALSVYLSTGITTWACLSTAGLMAIEVPPLSVTQEIIIAADNDDAGINAANKLADRLLAHSYKVKIARPTAAGTDFNDLLKEGL